MMETARNSVICIIGMHRSGTSCLAGCLEERGLSLGEVANVSANNPRGNKENKQIQTLNEEVLTASGGSWDRPPDRLVWDDSLSQRRDELITFHSENGIRGFKDPRTTITLPFWLQALPSMRLVATFRHPGAVAASLMKRKHLRPAIPPLELWRHYNQALLSLLDQMDIPLLCFDWPADTYVHAVEKIAGYLGLNSGPGFAFDFFDEQIRNHELTELEDGILGNQVTAIYSELVERSDAWR